MTPSRTEQAARNNAIWCDTVCRTHGTPGEFSDALWLNRHPMPRFYSNAVTLSDQQAAAAQLAHLRALVPCLASSLAVYSGGNWPLRGAYAGAPL